MKHKHYDMIVAKADNVALVVFARIGNEWYEPTASDLMMFNNGHDEYFLCLPQHKDACLHWLNGGRIQYKTELVPEYQDYQPDIAFSLGSIFMQEEFYIRIKPKREKRWIGVSSSSCHSTGHYKTKQEAVGITKEQPWANAYKPWQFIEIEVEV